MHRPRDRKSEYRITTPPPLTPTRDPRRCGKGSRITDSHTLKTESPTNLQRPTTTSPKSYQTPTHKITHVQESPSISVRPIKKEKVLPEVKFSKRPACGNLLPL